MLGAEGSDALIATKDEDLLVAELPEKLSEEEWEEISAFDALVNKPILISSAVCVIVGEILIFNASRKTQKRKVARRAN